MLGSYYISAFSSKLYWRQSHHFLEHCRPCLSKENPPPSSSSTDSSPSGFSTSNSEVEKLQFLTMASCWQNLFTPYMVQNKD